MNVLQGVFFCYNVGIKTQGTWTSMRKVLNTVPYFNIVAQTTENTVVTEYEPVKNRPDFYQSEAELEREFIILLAEQGYKYLQIHNV